MAIPKINSAHGSSTRNIINRAIEVLNRLGIDVQTLVAEGQLTPRQYADLITLINGLVKSGHVDKSDLSSEFKDEIEGFSAQLAQTHKKDEQSVDWENLTQNAREQMLGDKPPAIVGEDSVGGENVISNSLGLEHVNFVDKKQIFNGEYIHSYIVSIAGVSHTKSTSYPEAVSVVVPIRPGKHYIIKKESSDRFRVMTSETYDQESYNHGNRVLADYDNSDIDTFAFKAEKEENFLAVQVSNSGEETVLSIQETAIVPDKSIDYGHTTFSSKRDIFSGNYISNYALVSGSTSFGEGYPGGIIVIEKITPGKRYTFTKNEESDRTRIATFKEYPDQHLQEAAQTHVINDAAVTKYIFVPNPNENYLVIQLSNSNETPSINIHEEGLVGVAYQSMLEQYQTVQSKRQKLVGKFNELYTTEPTEDVTANSGKPLSNTTIDDIYGLYDELMQIYPLHFSKTLLGYGSTSEGTEDTTLPIYEYVINPPENDNMTGGDFIGQENTIAVLISTGVHGNEKNPVWSLYLFIKQMMENYKTNDVMMSLKSNIIFKIMPIANPGGYNDSSRPNRNGVNINRNFEYNFAVVGEDGGSNYSGQEPYSELENRVMRDWFEANKNANVYIDYHAFGHNLGENTISYHISKNPELDSLYASLLRVLSYKWKDKYFSNVNENEALGYNNSSSYRHVATSVSEAYHKFGIELSGTVETAIIGPDGTRDSPVVIETGVELLAGYLLAIVDKYFA